MGKKSTAASRLSKIKLKTTKVRLKPIRNIGSQKLSGSGF